MNFFSSIWELLSSDSAITRFLRRKEGAYDSNDADSRLRRQASRTVGGKAGGNSADPPAEVCTGDDDCPAQRHIHGCFADRGNCDHPSEHEGEHGQYGRDPHWPLDG